MRHSPLVFANAFAVTTAVVYVVCRMLVGLLPDLSFTIAQSWFHGIELTKLNSWNLTAEAFILGVVTATLGAWLVGYFFGITLNFFSKNK
ncbi:hypothetical protein HY045_02550 [Candidatus Woesebacteria bacterium]|nr:hypothetical protein [Candidatus Woesebacteria bacterium]